MSSSPISLEPIERRIFIVRGRKIMLDTDLAALYGVETRVLVQAVKRNLDRFPQDFMFRMSNQDLAALRSQSVISNRVGRGGRTSAPYAFSEHGTLMAATVLNSRRAVEMSLYVVRAFVRMREVLTTHKVLAKKLEALEKATEALALNHDALAARTREQFREVIEALRALMEAPPTKKRPIGFIAPE